jgi:putative transposase
MLIYLMILLSGLWLILLWRWVGVHLSAQHNSYRRRSANQLHQPDEVHTAFNAAAYQRRKPDWMKQEVVRLKALMGNKTGCRAVAITFNRLHGPQATVGKTYVSDVIKNNQYRLVCLIRDIRNKSPASVEVNAIWAMDLTFHTATSGETNMHKCLKKNNATLPILGILDHGSRLVVHLGSVINKRSWTLLGHLCLAIGRYGKPSAVRTDNEKVFTGKVFRLFLKLVGIRHQRTQVCAPWQNGRMERLFGTLKPLLKQLVIPGVIGLQMALDEFTLFYNYVRPHQNLAGLKPAEVWQGLNSTDWRQAKQATYRETKQTWKQPELVQALDGLLVGYYMRR